jgi:hypothetical protein
VRHEGIPEMHQLRSQLKEVLDILKDSETQREALEDMINLIEEHGDRSLIRAHATRVMKARQALAYEGWIPISQKPHNKIAVLGLFEGDNCNDYQAVCIEASDGGWYLQHFADKCDRPVMYKNITYPPAKKIK